MRLASRPKWTLAALLVYWPALFIGTHLPIHDLGRRAGMSDKTMHVLGYLGLVFLSWAALSPQSKVRWLKAKVWIVLVVIVLYGIIDEVLQGFVGRSTDPVDFAADVAGVVMGLGILTFLSLWPAALVVSAIFTFVLSNMARIDQIAGMPFLNVGFHFAAYAVFTLAWIQCLGERRFWEMSAVRWFVVAVSLPGVLLLAVKAAAPLFGRPVWPVEWITATTAIVLAAAASRFVCRTVWLSAGPE